MKHLDHQDKIRYWKISQVRSSAEVFSRGAEHGFRKRFGELAGGAAQAVFGAVGTLFGMTGDLLDGLEKSLDRARHARSFSRTERRQAFRARDTAYKALRAVVCQARQFVDSITGGRGNAFLGVRGATPRTAEKIAPWGRVLAIGLRSADLPPEARALAAAFADEIERLTGLLDEAIERADLAWASERLDNAELREVRGTVDAELAEIIAYLRTHLELAGYPGLARRVLGKRRGRPRKARKKSDPTARPATEAARKSDSAPRPATEAARKSDFEPAEASPEALGELRKIEQAPSEPCRASREIAEGPNEAREAPQKIDKALCQPCREPSREEEVPSFQEDTPRFARRRRRRVAEALLGASKRWLASGWMGGWVSGERRRRRGSGRG